MEQCAFWQLPISGVSVLSVHGSERLWTYFHERYCITVVRSGTGTWRTRGKSYEIAPETLMVMEPGDLHTTTAVQDAASFEAVFIEPGLVATWFRESLPRSGVPSLVPSVARPEAFATFSDALTDPACRVEASAAAGKLVAALAGLLGPDRLSAAPSCDARLYRARDAIEDSYRALPYETVNIQHIADEVGADYYWLERRFRDHFGVAPYRYAKHVRAARARELILGGPTPEVTTMKAVACRAGYYDYGHMRRELKNLFGVSPTELAIQVRSWRHLLG